jgi:Kef-type K+ transport system membrane component KefB
VVWEILFGLILGPAVLGLASISQGELWSWFAPAGPAALLFLAGMDIDFERLRGRPIELALGGWILSLGRGLFLTAILWVLGIVQAPTIVALALSTTALGTIIPSLLSVLLLPAIADATLPPPAQSETASATD